MPRCRAMLFLGKIVINNNNFQLALNNITFFTKSVYIHLRQFNIVEPIKQQKRGSKNLKIQFVDD